MYNKRDSTLCHNVWNFARSQGDTSVSSKSSSKSNKTKLLRPRYRPRSRFIVLNLEQWGWLDFQSIKFISWYYVSIWYGLLLSLNSLLVTVFLKLLCAVIVYIEFNNKKNCYYFYLNLVLLKPCTNLLILISILRLKPIFTRINKSLSKYYFQCSLASTFQFSI